MISRLLEILSGVERLTSVEKSVEGDLIDVELYVKAIAPSRCDLRAWSPLLEVLRGLEEVQEGS